MGQLTMFSGGEMEAALADLAEGVDQIGRVRGGPLLSDFLT
jgi:hypothetical protein